MRMIQIIRYSSLLWTAAFAQNSRLRGGSIVFNTAINRSDVLLSRKPHIAITCPQNSACTMFAMLLCVLLDADVCRPDTGASAVNWNVPMHMTYIFKSTFTGTSINSLRKTLAAHDFSHRLLWYNDPIRMYNSLIHKRWCGNVGGFENKMQVIDISYLAFYKKRLSSCFDAVLFETDVYEGSGKVLAKLLTQLDLSPYLLSDAKEADNNLLLVYNNITAQGRISRRGVVVRNVKNGFPNMAPEDIIFGNWHPGPLRVTSGATERRQQPTLNSQQHNNLLCAFSPRVQALLPNLFKHYHPNFDVHRSCGDNREYDSRDDNNNSTTPDNSTTYQRERYCS